MTNENKPELPSAEAIDPEQSEPTTKSSVPKALQMFRELMQKPRSVAMQQTPEFKAKVLKAMAKAEQRRKENPSPQKQEK